ncbi:MAG: NAD(P)-dependent oxidoreductase [Planctomycetota bacterium]
MARILLTGGRGVVGMPLGEELARRGHQIHIADLGHSPLPNYTRCDVGEYRQLERVIKEHKFDYVYHLAGEFGRMNGEHYYESMWRTNAVGTKNLLKLQEQHRFRAIYFSSSEIYGDYPELMSEDVPDRVPLKQMNDYAISKWVNELQILNSAARTGVESVRVRLFNTYGPGETYSEYRSVICRFAYCALHDMPYTVFESHHRSFTYIDDCVRTLANIADYFHPGEVYNVSGEEYWSIKQLSDAILTAAGKDDRYVKYEKVEHLNTLNKKGCAKKSIAHLKHEVRVPLRQGIPKTVAWMKNFYGK